MSMLQLLVAICASTISLSYTSREEELEDQKEELSFIKHYELIHVNVDSYSSDKIIEFDVFNRHYTVQLILNTGLSPLTFYAHDNGTEEEIPTVHEPCYFNGREVNDDKSNVALSLCENGEDGTGIIGWVKAFNETIYMKPLTYYTAPSIVPKLTDQHLVYRSSDYDWARRPFTGSGIKIPKDLESDNGDDDDGSPQRQSRHLLAYGEVEILAVIDKNYPMSKVKAGFNEANAAYHDSSLSSSLQLTITLSKAVTKTLSGCSKPDSCLSAMDNYMRSDSSDADYAIYLGYIDDGAGVSYVSGICGSHNTGVCFTQHTWLGTCIAHELGHNLGADHDSRDNEYVMSPSGSSGMRDWSSLSNDYFSQGRSDWKRCLKSNDVSGGGSGGSGDSGSGGSGDYYGYYGSGGDGSGGGDDTNYDYYGSGGGGSGRGGGSGDSSSCVKISDFRGKLGFMNGYWSGSGGTYTKDGYTISRMAEEGIMYWGVNGEWEYGWCDKSALEDCGGDWDTYRFGNGWGSFRTSSSCSGRLTVTDCYDEYDERLCVEMDSNLTEITDIYELDYSEGCYNDEPVWRYSNDTAESIFYLHYNTIGEWVITKGGMMESQHEAIYFCEMNDLFECNDGNWRTKKTREDMIELEVVDINVEQCGNGEESKNAKSSKSNIGWIVVFILLSVLVMLILVLFIHKMRTPKIKHVNVDEDSADEESHEIVVMDTGN